MCTCVVFSTNEEQEKENKGKIEELKNKQTNK